jgi:hypothetical protein
LGLQGCLLHLISRHSHRLSLTSSRDLQSHAINDELHGKVLAIGWHTIVQRRLRGIVLSVLVNQVPHHLVQHSRPHGADGVYSVQRVNARIGERVSGERGGVWICANAGGAVVDPRTHCVVFRTGVAGLRVELMSVKCNLFGRGHVTFIRMAVAMKSPHPSPMPPDSRAFKQFEFAGPPVRRLETP